MREKRIEKYNLENVKTVLLNMFHEKGRVDEDQIEKVIVKNFKVKGELAKVTLVVLRKEGWLIKKGNSYSLNAIYTSKSRKKRRKMPVHLPTRGTNLKVKKLLVTKNIKKR